MIVARITGQSGSGKTTAALIFSQLGFYHIDCDRLVHEKVYKNPQLLKTMADMFGKHCVSDGVLNRKELGKIVFSDKKSYDMLMELVMPYVNFQIKFEIMQCGEESVLVDAPMLFEYGLDSICTVTVGVVAQNTVERICNRDGISISEAQKRLANQKNADFYRVNCNYVIENDGDFKSLEKRVREIADKILKGTFT